jgi:hypothetical protein
MNRRPNAAEQSESREAGQIKAIRSHETVRDDCGFEKRAPRDWLLALDPPPRVTLEFEFAHAMRVDVCDQLEERRLRRSGEPRFGRAGHQLDQTLPIPDFERRFPALGALAAVILDLERCSSDKPARDDQYCPSRQRPVEARMRELIGAQEIDLSADARPLREAEVAGLAL